MATGSPAERFAHYRGRAEAVVYAGPEAPVDDNAEDIRLTALEMHGQRTGPYTEVPGIVEATQHCMVPDLDDPENGAPWILRGPSTRGRLGMTFSADHPVVRAHPELFVPLRLPVDFPWPEPDMPQAPGRFG